jgi:hypothetical protein
MQRAFLAKRLADHWPLGLAVAVGLAFIPLANWLGVILALVLVLRQGGLVPSLGYGLVSLVAYFTLTGYSFTLLGQEWGAVLVLFLPLWVMAWLLRGLRSLSLAMAGGTLVTMVLILLMRLIQGPPTVDAWMAFVQCRMQVAGIQEAQLAQYLPGGDLRTAVQAMMLAWPFTTSLLQLGLLFAARWLQARWYYPGGFQRDFHGLRQPRLVAFVAGILIMALILAPQAMVTLIHLGILALVLMGVTGLGMVHGFVAGKRYSPWWLVLVYGLLAVNTWIALFILALLAIVSPRFNFN